MAARVSCPPKHSGIRKFELGPPTVSPCLLSFSLQHIIAGLVPIFLAKPRPRSSTPKPSPILSTAATSMNTKCLLFGYPARPASHSLSEHCNFRFFVSSLAPATCSQLCFCVVCFICIRGRCFPAVSPLRPAGICFLLTACGGCVTGCTPEARGQEVELQNHPAKRRRRVTMPARYPELGQHLGSLIFTLPGGCYRPKCNTQEYLAAPKTPMSEKRTKGGTKLVDHHCPFPVFLARRVYVFGQPSFVPFLVHVESVGSRGNCRWCRRRCFGFGPPHGTEFGSTRRYATPHSHYFPCILVASPQ